MSLVSAASVYTLYDSAAANNIATNFNTSSTLFSFQSGSPGYYLSGTGSSVYYSISQINSLGIVGFNSTFFIDNYNGIGNEAAFSFGQGTAAFQGYEAVNNGYHIDINRNATFVDIYRMWQGSSYLIKSYTLSTLTDQTFFPMNFSYNGTHIFFHMNDVYDIFADDNYTLSDSTGFKAAVYRGGTNGERMAVKNMYILTESASSGPNVTLISPENDYGSINPSVTFEVSVTDNTGVKNVTLYVDGGINETNSSGYNGTYTFNKMFASGSHNWSITAYDIDDQKTESATRDFYIDSQAPSINITSPGTFIGIVRSGYPINLDWEVSDNEVLDQCWYEYGNNTIGRSSSDWSAGGFPGSDNLSTSTNYSIVNSVTMDFTLQGGENETYTNLDPSCYLRDTFELQLFKNMSGTYYACLDENSVKKIFHLLSGSIVSSPPTWINLENKTSVNCSDNNTTFNYVSGVNSIALFANDIAGNVGYDTRSWTYQFIEKNRIYDDAVIKTEVTQFKLVLEKVPSIISSSAVLVYNGTEYASTKVSSGNNINFSNSITVPSDIIGNVSFYWEITFSNSSGTYYANTSESNQTVYNLSLVECTTPPLNGLALNFTVYDSTNLTALNATLEATFQLYGEGGSGSQIVEYLFSDLNENRSNFMYCIESSGQNVTLDAFISYGATDHDTREYIIDNGIIGNFTQNIPLYLTLTSLTDIVTVTVQDQDYNPVTGALVAIQRWNIGTNTYATIGTFTTSSTGQGIIDLELYTTWYRAVVYVDGEIVKITDVQKLSSTDWTISVQLGIDNPYDLFGSISRGLTFDNVTNITSFTWLDSSGYTSRGCLVVLNHTDTGDVEIENECVDSVSGTIDYQIIGNGSFTAYGIVYLSGYDVSQIVDVLPIQIGTTEITRTVSPFGKVISFISIGTAGLLGVAAGSAILGGALLLIVLIALMKFGFLDITTGFVWGIASIIVIIWFLQRRKRG